MAANIKNTATTAVSTNRLYTSGGGLQVTITRRKVAGGIRVRITATRLDFQNGHTTQSDFIDFASEAEAGRAFRIQCTRWHNFVQAQSKAAREAYTQAA